MLGVSKVALLLVVVLGKSQKLFSALDSSLWVLNNYFYCTTLPKKSFSLLLCWTIGSSSFFCISYSLTSSSSTLASSLINANVNFVGFYSGSSSSLLLWSNLKGLAPTVVSGSSSTW